LRKHVLEVKTTTQIWKDIGDDVDFTVRGFEKVEQVIGIMKEIIEHLSREHGYAEPEEWLSSIKVTRKGVITINLECPYAFSEHWEEVARKVGSVVNGE